MQKKYYLRPVYPAAGSDDCLIFLLASDVSGAVRHRSVDDPDDLFKATAFVLAADIGTGVDCPW